MELLKMMKFRQPLSLRELFLPTRMMNSEGMIIRHVARILALGGSAPRPFGQTHLPIDPPPKFVAVPSFVTLDWFCQHPPE